MKLIDIVLKQIEENTRNKELVKKLSANVKRNLAHVSPTDYNGKEISPQYLIDTINYVRNSTKVINPDVDLAPLHLMLLCQSAFYGLSTNINSEQMAVYDYYVFNYKDVYDELLENIKSLDKLEFIYSMDLSLPMKTTIKSINNHCDALKIAVKSLNKIINHKISMENKGLMPFLVFHQEAIGNNIVWIRKACDWYALHEVYKLHHIDGMDKTEVIKRVPKSVFTRSLKFNSDSSNAIHKLDRILEKAKKLITSAENGTFPY